MFKICLTIKNVAACILSYNVFHIQKLRKQPLDITVTGSSSLKVIQLLIQLLMSVSLFICQRAAVCISKGESGKLVDLSGDVSCIRFLAVFV